MEKIPQNHPGPPGSLEKLISLYRGLAPVLIGKLKFLFLLRVQQDIGFKSDLII